MSIRIAKKFEQENNGGLDTVPTVGTHFLVDAGTILLIQVVPVGASEGVLLGLLRCLSFV